MAGFIALAMAFCMVLASAPASAYYSPASGEVWLYDSGATTMNATTDWRFNVVVPQDLDLADTYWNFTIYGQFVGNSGAASNGTYLVNVYVNDGVINRTAQSSMVMVVDDYSKVYGNISFGADVISLFSQNSSATCYITLYLSTTEKDAVQMACPIAANAMGGTFNSMVPLIVSVMMLGLVIGVLGGMQGSLGGIFKQGGSRKKRKK